MSTAKVYREHLVNVDSKGRVVLPREVRRSGLYAVEVTDKDEIILRPRVAVDPREVISKKTLTILDESMRNFSEGKAGRPIDLTGFNLENEANETKITTKRKQPRHR